MGLTEQLAKLGIGRKKRSNPGIGMEELLQVFSFNGTQYGILPMLQSQTLGNKQEWPSGSFESYIQGIYKTNGVVFACMAVRMHLFSEMRFQFRQRSSGRPGKLFGTQELDILEHPWPNGTTGDLLSRAIQDVDVGGNHYAARRGNTIYRMRPDWVTIVLGSRDVPDNPALAMDAELLGFLYQPGGGKPSPDAQFLTPQQVAHFAPIPDPAFRFRGMSWLTPVLPEIMGDSAMTAHKLKFFEQGATPNLVVTLGNDMTEENFNLWVKTMTEKHEGVANAYKTLWLANGAQPQVIGANLRQVDFKVTQGHGETRIAAAAGIPPIIVGLSEGLDSATYSNYAQARRRLADGTMRPLWRNIAGSYSTLINLPGNAELWYDDRDIAFLQESLQDAADIQTKQASAIKVLVDAGFNPETVIAAVMAGDLAQLTHSGLYSIQLQPPGSEEPKWTAPSIKFLVDAGFEPNSVVKAIAGGDIKLLVFDEKKPAPAPVIPPASEPPAANPQSSGQNSGREQPLEVEIHEAPVHVDVHLEERRKRSVRLVYDDKGKVIGTEDA